MKKTLKPDPRDLLAPFHAYKRDVYKTIKETNKRDHQRDQ